MTLAIPENFAHWLPTAAVAAIIVVAALMIYSLAVRLPIRLTRQRRVARRFIVDCARPAGALMALAILQSLLQGEHDGLAWLAGVRHISGLALILVFTWAAIAAVNAAGDLIIGLNPAVEGRHHVARKLETKTRFLTRGLIVLIAIIGLASALMTFPSIRQLGTSLLASAGIGGLILGFAARPVLGNLLAGLQIALTQPFKIEDVLWIQGEWCCRCSGSWTTRSRTGRGTAAGCSVPSCSGWVIGRRSLNCAPSICKVWRPIPAGIASPHRCRSWMPATRPSSCDS